MFFEQWNSYVYGCFCHPWALCCLEMDHHTIYIEMYIEVRFIGFLDFVKEIHCMPFTPQKQRTIQTVISKKSKAEACHGMSCHHKGMTVEEESTFTLLLIGE